LRAEVARIGEAAEPEGQLLAAVQRLRAGLRIPLVDVKTGLAFLVRLVLGAIRSISRCLDDGLRGLDELLLLNSR